MTTYADRDDIEDVFGNSNTAIWADLDNDADSTKITARIDKALAFADAKINSYLASSIYTIPFTSPDPLIIDLAAKLAGLWLYENRGIKDTTEDGKALHRFTWIRTEVDATLKRLKHGWITLVNETPVGTSIPEAEVSEDEDENELETEI